MPAAADFGLTEEEFAGVQALRQMQEAQGAINALASTEVDIRREIAGMIDKAAAEAEQRASSAAALEAQFAGVAAIQEQYTAVVQMQDDIAAGAERAGLSISQTDAIMAQAAAQYAILTENGYAPAEAIGMFAV